MRKKYISIALIIAFIGIFNFFDDIKGSVEPNLIFFDTDKESYYIDEEIIINASWELDYNNLTDISFVQVRVIHENGTLLWNSPEYHDIGTFQNNWTVKISDLNILLKNSSIKLTVQFCLFYWLWDVEDPIDIILDEILVDINKREISCQLIGFSNVLRFGDSLSFQARFFDTLSNSSSYLIDQKIECKIITNNKNLLETNFTINSSGFIEVNLNNLNITKDQNYLIFTIKDNDYYNDSKFEYEIILEDDSLDSGKINQIPLDFLPFISIPFLLLVFIAIIFLDKNKKSKHRKLIDITIKY